MSEPAAAPMHLSKSQLGCLATCGLKYKYRYVEKVRAPMSAKVAAGIGLHKAIARYYLAMKQELPLPSPSELLLIALAAWENFGERDGLEYGDPPNDKAGLAQDLDLALREFAAGIGPELRPWGVEVHAPYVLKYEDVEQPIDAYIDLVLDDPGKTIIDWKFTQRFTEAKDVGHDHALYSLWHSERFGLPTTRFLTIQFVRLKRGVEVRRAEFVVTPEDRAWHVRHVLYPRLKQKQFGIYPAEPSACSWCEYRKTCRPTL